MNCNMGRRSSGGRHGLNMLVRESARVGPDIIVREGVVMGEVMG